MKKKLILLIFIGMNLSVYAQSIMSDEVNSEGVRHILGSLENVRDLKDQEVFSVGLGALQVDTIEQYFLNVKVTELSPYRIQKGALLIIKPAMGDIITLHSMNNYDATVRDVHNINGYVFSDYSTIASYPIEKQQLLQLISGVLKIRQETFTGTHDKEYKKDKIGLILKEEYILIAKALRTKKDIYDGF